jgi:hypothetical protein
MTNPTINLGSGKWATKEGELLGYSKFNPKEFLPQSFDVSRASSATVVNRDGLIESVANNIARVDFADNVNGALLLEPQGTNLVTYSETLQNFSFGRSLNIQSNEINPSGLASSRKFQMTTDVGSHYFHSGTSSLSGAHTFSAFVKKGNYRYIGIKCGLIKGNFDFDTETFTGVNGSFKKLVNDWYRISIIGVFNGSFQYFGCYFSDVNGNEKTNADGTEFYYVFGAQLEPSLTSYIPTNGTTVTRLADVVGGAGDVNTFNDSEGVLYAEIAALSDDLTNREISLSDGTTNNRLEIRYSSTSNRMQVISRVNSTIVSNLSFILNNSTDFNKIAFKYKENDFALWINGVEVDTDLSGSTYPTSTLNKISFNNGAGGESFFGKVKDIQYYNTALTDSELTQLTTI